MLLLGSQIIAAFTKSFSFEKDQSLSETFKFNLTLS